MLHAKRPGLVYNVIHMMPARDRSEVHVEVASLSVHYTGYEFELHVHVCAHGHNW